MIEHLFILVQKFFPYYYTMNFSFLACFFEKDWRKLKFIISTKDRSAHP